jgi:hypothetical protein
MTVVNKEPSPKDLYTHLCKCGHRIFRHWDRCVTCDFNKHNHDRKAGQDG